MATPGSTVPELASGVQELLTTPSVRGRYPTGVLQDAETALLLFAAGFYGKNDGAWFAEAGLKATCVDLDAEKLWLMRRYYPRDWLFVHGDVFNWAADCPNQYDVVSVDPPTVYSMACLTYLDRWARLATNTVVLGLQRQTLIDYDQTPNLPGWSINNVVTRNSQSLWLVLERT